MRIVLLLVALAGCAARRPATRALPPHPWLAPSLRLGVEDRMGAGFVLLEGELLLDRRSVWSRRCTERCPGPPVREVVLDGPISPGPHELVARFVFRSEGHGIFSYLRAYRFRVDSRRSFEAEAGRGRRVEVVAYERGGPTTPLEERPAVGFRERVVDL